MKTETEKKFFDRFSFIKTSGDPKKDLLCFGFECGEGWKDLLWDLCLKLEYTEKDNEHFQVMQVKEKFGSLRFYVSVASDESFDLIAEAENISTRTCEICGEPGEIKTPANWLKCRCKDHK